MLSLKLDLLQTLTLAAVLHFGGLQLRKWVGILNRLNIPAAVLGGLAPGGAAQDPAAKPAGQQPSHSNHPPVKPARRMPRTMWGFFCIVFHTRPLR